MNTGMVANREAAIRIFLRTDLDLDDKNEGHFFANINIPPIIVDKQVRIMSILSLM
ncbi:hypothetical protein D3C75_836090 [compost metagenome]